jgi:Rps23 Pro-64 3,4-dihydroxylase Tpa1-like proline 4-hydroxylase
MSHQQQEQQKHPLADSVRRAFTGDALKQFQEEGYCVLKNVVEEAAAQKYLDEIQKAFEKTKSNPFGRFEPNKVEFLLASGPIQLVKPNVFESDLHKPEQRKGLDQLGKIFEGSNDDDKDKNKDSSSSSFGDAERISMIINERFPEMKLTNSSNFSSSSDMSQHITLKLQVNQGGAFPIHHDNPGPPSKRKLTLALYLTKNWQNESHGGELVLQPFLGREIVIPPIFNTLVLFRSDLISHRVNPEKLGSRRFCFTIWFDSLNVNSDDEVNLRAKHLTREFISVLKTSPIHRSLMRAVYDEEFKSSLKDCFGEGTRELMISLKMHEAHIAPLLKNPQVAEFVKVLRDMK